MLELDVDIRRGSFHLQIACRLAAPWTVLYGPSGAGKSTLLRAIAGLDLPSRGKSRNIVFDGEPLPSSRGIRLRTSGLVGMAAQNPALFPHLNVAANVGYGLAKISPEVRHRRGAAMLDLVGASHLADRWPASLSGGEAQRVSLARALAPGPRLLLLDEPLSALGAAARDQLIGDLLAWVARQQMQTLLVTHDAADALATQSEILVLEDGRVAAQGQASEVLAEESARLIARLSRG